MTLEEAQAQIITLNETITQLTNERDTIQQNFDTQAQELESVRKLNQQYFNKLSAQYSQEPDETNNDDEIQSCEDFAKTLKFF